MDTKTRIKAARSRLGITQKVVADHCGVSITTVSKWEHGEALPQRGDNLDKLCELLKVSKPFLIWGGYLGGIHWIRKRACIANRFID